MKKDDVPEDFTELEYARSLLENTCGWPAKGNLEMIADCITAVSKAKRLTLPKAYKYIVRAVELAKQQGIKVDRFFFQGGEYMNVRPRPTALYEERPIPPRLQDLAERERKRMMELADRKKMP